MMNERANYIIECQLLEVAFRDGRKGMGLPNELAAFFRERIAPLLEMVLEEEDRPGYYIQLDRIQLDVGVLPAGQWERLLPERVIRKFREELRSQIQARALTATGKEAESTEGRGWQDVKGVVFQTLLHFLRTGALGSPGVPSLASLERQVAELLPEQASVNWRGWLVKSLAEEPASLERFLLQMDPGLQDKLLEWLGYGSQQVTISVSGPSQPKPVVKKRLETLLRLMQGLSMEGSSASSNPEAPGLVLENMISRLSAPPLEEELRRLLPEVPVNMRRRLEEQRPTPPDSGRLEAPGHFIGNAGLVLLHPFLPAFMRQMGLLDPGGGWQSPAAQERGLWLTQFLVAGTTELEEPEIVLNKLLCGYPMDQAVSRYWEPLPEEVKETERLLEQVIAHWPALKDTGVGGLRANFLLRQGKLRQVDDLWLLQVEQKGWDVLLNYLPWSIGYVKNQWMEERLVVEWA